MNQMSDTPPEGGAELCLDKDLRKVRLNPVQASRYLAEVYGTPVAVATLAKWRCVKSDGPAFDRFGRSIFYRRLALDAWASARLGESLRSTSEG